jgi:hypothetical protein
MLEILSPAVSPEGVIAAVQTAPTPYMWGFGITTPEECEELHHEEFRRRPEYACARRQNLSDLQHACSDRELPALAEQAKIACRYGADALSFRISA